jgi:chloramphenicol O-acetyltransferase
MNKIFTLDSKQGEVLTILTTKEDITYTDFYNMCKEAGEEFDNDFYMLKDKLINELNFEVVEVLGGYISNKKRGAF